MSDKKLVVYGHRTDRLEETYYEDAEGVGKPLHDQFTILKVVISHLEYTVRVQV